MHAISFGFLVALLFAPSRSTCLRFYALPPPPLDKDPQSIIIGWNMNTTNSSVTGANVSTDAQSSPQFLSVVTHSKFFSQSWGVLERLEINSSELPVNITVQGIGTDNEALGGPTNLTWPMDPWSPSAITIYIGTSPSTSTFPTSTSTSTSTAASLTDSSQPTHIGTPTIAGATIGAVALILLIVAFLLWLRRRRRQTSASVLRFDRDKMVREVESGEFESYQGRIPSMLKNHPRDSFDTQTVYDQDTDVKE
ncbi:hypothetical protein BDP27DRAFT_1447369 [Rhodocollybia butyracea]|uniref:Uncharacterized protein n=1 Tax=Rhodocollybia butyracea TaxID=206335 RepID=A0A9P5PPP9_9AGAR|nr:hypothetical protein BDP27DRAFT_1447369 [Rhodocollybia butyracea]